MSTSKKKWVDGEHPEYVDFMKGVAQDTDPWFTERAKKILESDHCEPRNPHIPASPLFELSSIKISKDSFLVMEKGYDTDGDSCVIELYGHIRLVDDKGNVFTLFKLDHKDAKAVILEDVLSVILRKSQLGSSLRHLYCILDYNVERTTRKFPRLESSLEMGFSTFHCALLAYVGVTFLSVGSDQIDSKDVRLKLGASIKLGNREICHELFDEPLNLKFGDPFELCVLAVPVYSPLKILADLKFDGEETIVIELEFIPEDTRYKDVYEKEIVGQKCRMLVSVTWEHAFDKLPESYLREWADVPTSSYSESESINQSKP